MCLRMCFVHFASICFMSVATLPTFIFLSNVALDPHSILISSGSVHLDFIIFAATFSSTSLFLAPFLFALVLWYRTPSLSPPHLSVFYASPLAFLSFFCPSPPQLRVFMNVCHTYICIYFHISYRKSVFWLFSVCATSHNVLRVFIPCLD